MSTKASIELSVVGAHAAAVLLGGITLHALRYFATGRSFLSGWEIDFLSVGLTYALAVGGARWAANRRRRS